MAARDWGDRPLLLAVDSDARLLGRIEADRISGYVGNFSLKTL
jgi:hypothetical protein